MSVTDNPVSISLGGNESITVPTEETWKVFITGSSGVLINGDEVVNSSTEPRQVETVVTSGDIIATDGSTDYIHIGGFSL